MRVRTSAAVAIAIPLAIWLLGHASTAAGEIEIAAGEVADARPEASGLPEAGPGRESGRYQRILVSPLRVAYSNDSGLGWRRELAPKDLLRFQRYYREAVEKHLGRTHPIAAEPSTDVLRVETVLVDPVVDKSAWNVAAKNVYSELQTITLIVVLLDSRTGDLVHQVTLPVRLGTSRWLEQNAVTYWGQVRLVFSRVAMRVQRSIEGVTRPASF
jgi:hypothetical protein